MSGPIRLIFAGCILGALWNHPFALATIHRTPINSSGAPVPSPIVYGKKAFISFELAGNDQMSTYFTGGPERAYGEFYQEMKQWGGYQLVMDPKDAEVVFAVRYVARPAPAIHLDILDPAGRISLWGIDEEIEVTSNKKKCDENFTAAIELVVNDLKLLRQSSGTQGSGKP